MSIFKKQIKFVSAICPECKGNLELDANLGKAFCQYCGAQCIVENAPQKKNRSKLEMVLDFLDHQNSLHRQDKRERKRREEEEKTLQREHLKKYGWVYVSIVGILFGIVFTMALLEEMGII